MRTFPFLTCTLLSLDAPPWPQDNSPREEVESSATLLTHPCGREADTRALEQLGSLHSSVVHSLLPSSLITSTVSACCVTGLLLPDAHIFHFP